MEQLRVTPLTFTAVAGERLVVRHLRRGMVAAELRSCSGRCAQTSSASTTRDKPFAITPISSRVRWLR